MTPTELKILLSLATVGLAALIVVSSVVILRARDAARSAARRLRLVKLEHIAAFAKAGCIQCHKTGVLQRRPSPYAPPMAIPCGCASRRFLAQHAGDVEQLGGQVLWKLGRGPRHDAKRDARRDAGGAAAAVA